MVDPIDDIARQARQGSVSAIIQVLNEKLASSGIRTRAIFAQGVLQLLCEGLKPDQLEQSAVVPQVRQILESLRPRNIRRVNINCRVVREQQLLWLEEISRDPDNQLLWSEEITLRQPTLMQRLTQDAKDRQFDPARSDLPKPTPKRLAREKKLFWRGLVGGASLSLFLLLLGWATYNWLSSRLSEAASSQTAPSQTASGEAPSAAPVAPSPPSTAAPAKVDPFAEAVRLAEETVTAGQSAQTSADWLEVATRWQRASDLMSQIPSTDSRYATAQNRVQQYRQNSETALQRAQRQ
ncbi:hypothetical protein IFO70_06105 [Phormidium tenue FACHB-886]|nr:hypothetical protein [Phormidium tenue FACHB-886]